MQTIRQQLQQAGLCQTTQQIRQRAHAIHADVNQHYDGKPYAIHLDMVADNVLDLGAQALDGHTEHLLPVVFGAYFHDTIEDARLTYNNVLKIARQYMPAEQADLATEIVYALTNDKGRTRAERAGEPYYAGIRATPYAAMVKMADRLANYTYSCTHADTHNRDMRQTYSDEMPAFLQKISPDRPGNQHIVPVAMLARLDELATL